MSHSSYLRPLAAAALLVIGTPAKAADAPVTYYPRADDLPFSEAVKIDNRLILSGQIGVGDDGLTVVPGGFEPEARRAMANIGAILQKHGLGYNDITLCTVMLADISKWADFNGIYRSYFQKGHYPARVTYGVTGLPRGGLIEIACQARFK